MSQVKPKYACPVCHERVFKSLKPIAGYYTVNVGGQSKDPQIDIDGEMYHKSCAKCNICSVAINPGNFGDQLYSTEFATLICKSCITSEVEPALVIAEDQASGIATPSNDHVLANTANKQGQDRAFVESFLKASNVSYDISDPLYNRNDPSTFSNYQDFTVHSLGLSWDIHFEEKSIYGSAAYELTVLTPGTVVVELDISEITISSARINSKEMQFRVKPSSSGPTATVRIGIPTALQAAGSEISLELDYFTSPDASAIQWLDPVATKGGVYPYIFTQSQAIHARSMFPSFDCPGLKCPYSAKVRVPAWCTVLMSAVESRPSEPGPIINGKDTRLFFWDQSVPVPAYLVALAAGNLASSDLSHRVRIWAEPEVVGEAAWEFAQTEDFLQAAEAITGCPYQWNRYDILCLPPSFPYGGMENPCLTFATPTLLAGDRSLANVIAHEIAHSWTGNLVTNATWNHFWLNEGWTVWLERNIMLKVTGCEDAYKMSAQGGWKHLTDDVGLLDPKWTSLVWPLEIGTDPDEAFSAVPYEKGYALLSYLEALVGRDRFLGFVSAYISNFARNVITSGEFKDFFLDHFSKDDPTNTAVHCLDWQSLLTDQGLPTHPRPDLTNGLSKAASDLADTILAMSVSPIGTPRANDTYALTDISGWSTEQRTLFLDNLLLKTGSTSSPLSASALHAMDSQYGFSETRNAEIRFRWQILCLQAGASWVFPQVVDFVTSQGRMKYVRPLYRALRDCEAEGRALAVRTFGKHQQIYHPVARKMLLRDLKEAIKVEAQLKMAQQPPGLSRGLSLFTSGEPNEDSDNPTINVEACANAVAPASTVKESETTATVEFVTLVQGASAPIISNTAVLSEAATQTQPEPAQPSTSFTGIILAVTITAVVVGVAFAVVRKKH